MSSYFHHLAYMLVLTAGFAWAQQGSQQNTMPDTPPDSPDTQYQQNPRNPDQSPPAPVNPDEDNPRTQSGALRGTAPNNAAALQAQSQIQDALQRQMPSGAGNVSVSVANDNAIQLTGTVATDDQKQQAERIAHAAAPDQTIVNNISVSGPGRSAVGSTSGTTTPSASGEANETGQSSKLPQSDIGGTGPSDIQSRIQAAFRQEPSLARSSITVDTKDSSVELSGFVTSNAEERRAVEIAKTNAGGRKVISHLKVATVSK